MVRQEEAYLRTENLAAGYDGKAWIREISIHASRGEIVTLIGPNGAGKSTILKSIAGQLKPVGGVVSLDGRMMEQWPETELARRMAVMMTERMQPELMTCFDVAAMGRYPHTGRFGILSETDRAIVREALAMVHAEELEDREFSRISDGQKQRILLARAICQQPQIILMEYSCCKRNTLTLQLPVNRDSTSVSANHKNLRHTGYRRKLHRSVFCLIALCPDSKQRLHVCRSKNFLRHSAFPDFIFPHAHNVIRHLLGQIQLVHRH